MLFGGQKLLDYGKITYVLISGFIMWKKILSHLKEYKTYAYVSPVLMSIDAAAGVIIPFFMGRLVDFGIKAGNMSEVWKYGLIMLGITALILTIGVINSYVSSRAATGLSKNLRESFFSKIQSFSFSTIDKYSPGSLITRVTTDITFIQNAFFMMIRLAFRAPTVLILSTIMIININWQLSLVFIITIPIVYIFMLFLFKFVMPLFVQMFKKMDRLNTKIQEKLTGISVVKTFIRENYESEEFEKVASEVLHTQKKAEKIMVYVEPLGLVIGFGFTLFTLLAGGNQILKSNMTEGQFASFISYASFILMSAMMLMMALGQMIMAQAPAKRVTEILNEDLEIKDESHLKGHQVEKGSIEFLDVSFAYKHKRQDDVASFRKGPGPTHFGKKRKKIEPEEMKELEPVLHNISFKINAGETVGIIGSTGSGKSTLVQLIPRLYEVNKGKILIDDIDVNEYKIKDLRDAVSMVLQKNVLFAGTIKENLLWGDENASDEEIKIACEKAQAADFVEATENGYDSMLEQAATNLSGGQKQRLCIARALLKKPKILILDDSTSAVDMSTEARIRKALSEEKNKLTLIIIAQRISSIVEADKIIVLNNGKIDGIGSHNELLSSNEIYKDIYTTQMEGLINAS